MKRTITLLIATALIFGMSQCKKNVETITPSNLGEAVHITVNVDDGGKHIVYPGTGAYVFENGDKLYVGNGGHYVGTLEYNSDAFSGTIYPTSTEDYLHFYFVGGLAPSTTLGWGVTENFTVNISDQSSKLPVLSYNRSTEKYVDGNTTYYCTLENKCGLVKFKPLVATSKAIKVGGMKTEAKIDFATPGITSTETTGNVILYSESDEAKWAILLPQGQVNTPQVTINTFSSSITSVPPVINNLYYTTGVDITMVANGKLYGEFTVNSSGDKVHFSQGNLQYQASTNKWRFAEHQYDYLGTTTSQNSNTTTVTRDLFGWGTTGSRDTRTSSTNYQTNYNPYSTSSTAVGSSAPAYGSNRYGYGPDYSVHSNYGLTVANKSDWGMHAITNGGNTQYFGWRTLTKDEWVYVFNTRSTTSGVRYAKAIVNDVNGVIILPDNWNTSYYTLSSTNTTNAAFTSNTITLSDWNTKFEANGAVFLPAAGWRDGTQVSGVGSYGNYWSSNPSGSEHAYLMAFGPSSFDPSVYSYRYRGHSVRLVIACE